MAHITEFSIDGLAGRKKTIHYKLNRDVNVFFGENGCGKTSLLRILDAAMSGNVKHLKDVPFSSATVNIYSIDYKKTFSRIITRNKISNSPKQMKRIIKSDFGRNYIISESFLEDNKYLVELQTEGFDEKPPDSSWSHIYLSTWRLFDPESVLSSRSLSIDSPRQRGLSDIDFDAFFAESIERIWSRYSNKVLSLVRKIQENSIANTMKIIFEDKGSKKRKQLTENDLKMIFNRVTSFLKRQGNTITQMRSFDQFNRRFHDDNHFRSVVENINNTELETQKASQQRENLKNIITKLFRSNKKIRFTDEFINVISNEGDMIGLSSLSSGEKQALSILIYTLLADVNSLLIDEPELSLHIRWQEDIIAFMQQLNPKAQFIIATHSPEIMAKITDDKTFKL